MSVKFTAFLCCLLIFSAFAIAYSQDAPGNLYILSEKVGEEINMLERQKYNLFPSVQGFQYARYFILPDSTYIVELVTKDATDGSIKKKRLPRSKEIIMTYKRKIDGEVLQETPADTLYTVKLRDGNTLQGRIIQRNEESITIRTPAGLEIQAPRKSIISMKPLRGKMVGDQYFRVDPNYSRLLFAPTGRPLQKGDGYFSDYYVFFPGVAYGFTDYFSLMAGFSVIPGLSISEQLKYFAPRFGKQFSDNFALSAGALYMSIIDEVAAGVAFGVATFGEPDKSFTVGLGFGYAKEEEEDFEFTENPILVLGGNIRLSNSVALISENWLITGEGLDLSRQPLSIAVRLFGERITVDLGMIIVMEILDDGFPMPWLSFAYNFGN